MPRPPSVADSGQRDAFRQWFNTEFERSGRSKTSLAMALGYDSHQHVNKILSGRTFPMPETLRALCVELEISWPAAFAMAGYYAQLLDALADLSWLGSRWLHADDPSDHKSLSEFGVIRLRNSNPFQAFQNDNALRSRYIVGRFEDRLPIEIETTTPEGVPISEAEVERMRRMAESVQRPQFVILPKPCAAAILVAVTGFPRRGDIFKDGKSGYAADVLSRLGPLMLEAEAQRLNDRQRRLLPGSLNAARTVLSDSAVPFESRRPIAAEYVTAWADSVCRRFTFYARLAAFDYFGECGSSMSTITAYLQLPQLYAADLPEAATF
jgi:hypothetical protein